MNEERKIHKKIKDLEDTHKELDRNITELVSTAEADLLKISKLKKHKLAIKDQIVKLKSSLYPDIIA